MKTLKQLIEEKKKELGRTFNWSIFGENSESEKHVQSFLRNAMTESYLSALEDAEGEIEKEKADYKTKKRETAFQDTLFNHAINVLSQLKEKIKGMKKGI